MGDTYEDGLLRKAEELGRLELERDDAIAEQERARVRLSAIDERIKNQQLDLANSLGRNSLRRVFVLTDGRVLTMTWDGKTTTQDWQDRPVGCFTWDEAIRAP